MSEMMEKYKKQVNGKQPLARGTDYADRLMAGISRTDKGGCYLFTADSGSLDRKKMKSILQAKCAEGAECYSILLGELMTLEATDVYELFREMTAAAESGKSVVFELLYPSDLTDRALLHGLEEFLEAAEDSCQTTVLLYEKTLASLPEGLEAQVIPCVREIPEKELREQMLSSVIVGDITAETVASLTKDFGERDIQKLLRMMELMGTGGMSELDLYWCVAALRKPSNERARAMEQAAAQATPGTEVLLAMLSGMQAAHGTSGSTAKSEPAAPSPVISRSKDEVDKMQFDELENEIMDFDLGSLGI